MGNPHGMLRVRRGRDLLLAGDVLLGVDHGGGLLDRAIQIAHQPCPLDLWQDLRLPHKEVLPSQFLGDGVTKGGDGGCGHGDG